MIILCLPSSQTYQVTLQNQTARTCGFFSLFKYFRKLRRLPHSQSGSTGLLPISKGETGKPLCFCTDHYVLYTPDQFRSVSKMNQIYILILYTIHMCVSVAWFTGTGTDTDSPDIYCFIIT